jgi:hypothetical protein
LWPRLYFRTPLKTERLPGCLTKQLKEALNKWIPLMPFDKLTTNGIYMLPFVLSLSKDLIRASLNCPKLLNHPQRSTHDAGFGAYWLKIEPAGQPDQIRADKPSGSPDHSTGRYCHAARSRRRRIGRGSARDRRWRTELSGRLRAGPGRTLSRWRRRGCCRGPPAVPKIQMRTWCLARPR